MKYSFTLKDNNQKAYYLFTWFLFYVHVAAAAFTANNTSEAVKMSMYILLGFYCAIGIVFFVFRKRNKATETFSMLLAFFYVHFWLTQSGVWALIIFAAFFILVMIVKGKRTTVVFSLQGIALTRVFKTMIFPWSAMDNVILKDNILTIDFKTNKIIQVDVADQAAVIDETAFNRFCNEQMQLPQ